MIIRIKDIEQDYKIVNGEEKRGANTISGYYIDGYGQQVYFSETVEHIGQLQAIANTITTILDDNEVGRGYPFQIDLIIEEHSKSIRHSIEVLRKRNGRGKRFDELYSRLYRDNIVLNVIGDDMTTAKADDIKEKGNN